MAITPMSQHRTVLGKEATAEQVRLYSKFPEFRGFSDRTLDLEKFEATVLLALMAGAKAERVIFCAPQAHESWVIAQFNDVASIVFDGCKKVENKQKRVAIAKLYSSLFSKISITGRLLQLPAEPAHWMSFGFAVDDPIPEWVSNRLLP
jgi:hypothetical protein